MTIEPATPARPRTFSASWDPTSATADLERWCEFLAEHGVTWSPEAKDRDFVDQLSRSASSHAADGIELRLVKRASDALGRANDPRRLLRQVSSERPRRWYLLSLEERRALEQQGMRFDGGMTHPLLQLALIPVTLGVYFGARYACESAGLSPTLAWVIALVAYVLSVRVVRGRWPLQPAR